MRKLLNWLGTIFLFIIVSSCAMEEEEAIDQQAPSVKFLSPPQGAVFNSTMEVALQASDNIKIKKILITLNQATIAILEKEPFTVTVDLSIYKSATYTLKAVAFDPEGNSAEDIISVIVANEPSLDRPIGLVASKGDFGHKILLDWEDMPNAPNYQVFKFNSQTNNYVQIAQTTESQFEDTGDMVPLTKKYYKVRVFHSNANYSDFSDVDYGYSSGKTYNLTSSFGSEGMGPGQFLFPEHLSLDKEDNIYVSDPNINRIQKFGKDGSLQELFYSCSACRGIAFLSNGNVIITESEKNKMMILNPAKQIVKQWGSFGTGDAQFFYFRQIALDNENKLYVVDHRNDRVQKLDLEGNFITKWGNEGTGEGQFEAPVGIIFYKDMIAVSSKERIQFFTKNGAFIRQINLGAGVESYDLATDGTSLFIATINYVIRTDETGEVREKIGEGDFTWLTGIGINSKGDLITCDMYKRRISVYQKN